MSNRPPPLAGLGGTPVANASRTLSNGPVVSSVQSPSSATSHGAATSTSALRDEMVRALMPELRVLMDHLVGATVERSLAPLREKQIELEAAIKDLRNLQLRSEKAAIASAMSATPNQPLQTESRAFASPALPIMSPVALPQMPTQDRSRAGLQTAVAVAPYDASASLDIPSELNGARRKKVVAWAVAFILVVLLASVASLSVMSNMGTYL